LNNLNEGVGKKIVEALKKQSEIENAVEAEQPIIQEQSLGLDISSIDDISNQGLMSEGEDEITEVSDVIDLFSDDEPAEEQPAETFNDFLARGEKQQESASMPGNIVILKKLISQLPSGVTRHTGAQIIKQTMEALGISMKSVLTEAQEVQNNLKASSKECQMMIQEYKRKIAGLEKQSQNYQKQYSALNDLISLFIQTTK
jgi:hypothetical protein